MVIHLIPMIVLTLIVALVSAWLYAEQLPERIKVSYCYSQGAKEGVVLSADYRCVAMVNPCQTFKCRKHNNESKCAVGRG